MCQTNIKSLESGLVWAVGKVKRNVMTLDLEGRGSKCVGADISCLKIQLMWGKYIPSKIKMVSVIAKTEMCDEATKYKVGLRKLVRNE